MRNLNFIEGFIFLDVYRTMTEAKLDLILQKLDSIIIAINTNQTSTETPKKPKESKPITEEKRQRLSRVMTEAKRLTSKGIDKADAMREAWVSEKAGKLPHIIELEIINEEKES